MLLVQTACMVSLKTACRAAVTVTERQVVQPFQPAELSSADCQRSLALHRATREGLASQIDLARLKTRQPTA